ncbi:MAG TPA: alpha/beta hydrolase [Actinophytocola sp.]|uniref:PGAP1-like alpha/beta domain-containing protein n=1 Tax=Actinophytocola sp. TaxID=1872138 RepID=UPI002DBAD54A|nr:alpha/beta hydrolase [Actinophytocola sp.]HEU5473496.1 alpha/beta hydrolase [Actinophytocola sp.]
MGSPGPGVTDIRVGGGAGGTEARFEDLAAMGDLTDDVAADTLGIAMSSHRYLVDPNVVASAVLNPAGVARFEAAMLGALDGPTGLTATSAAIGLRGIALRATSAAYQEVDQLSARALDAIRWMEGAVVTSSPATAAPTALIGGGALAADVYLNYDGDWQRYLVEHPGMVDQLIGMSPGMLSSLGLPTDLATLMDLTAAAYPDGEPRVTDGGVDGAAGTPPRNLGDIMEGLDHRNGTDPNIDVRRVVGPDGRVAYIVDIPGTRVWNLPGQDGGSANDFGTNIDAMAGNETVLQKGIEEAMRRAGVGPNDPVMLVGHSQGGIVAARAAGDFAASGQYNVTHVVTAGSPVGRIPVPDGIQMLSLENSGDIVPHLDAAENPGSDNRTTVIFDNQTGTVGGNHAIGGNYTEAARQLDTSTDPSVQRFRDSAGVFIGGVSVETHQYTVERR